VLPPQAVNDEQPHAPLEAEPMQVGTIVQNPETTPSESAVITAGPVQPKSEVVVPKQQSAYITPEEMPTNIRCDITGTIYKKKIFAIDTESVGGVRTSLVGQVAVVDQFGQLVYDTYVQPNGKVLDYRTRYSGLTAEKLRGAPPLCQVQRELRSLFKGAVVIGHSLRTDLRGLGISVQPNFDTQEIHEYYRIGNHPPALRTLASRCYGINIQKHSHSPVEDAIVSMALFKRAYRAIPQYNHASFDIMAHCNCGECSLRKVRDRRENLADSTYFLGLIYQVKSDKITNYDVPSDDFDMRLFSSLIANDKVKFKKIYGIDEEQYQLLVQWWSTIKAKFKKK